MPDVRAAVTSFVRDASGFVEEDLDYLLGVAYLGSERVDEARDRFQRYLRATPDGVFAERARAALASIRDR